MSRLRHVPSLSHLENNSRNKKIDDMFSFKVTNVRLVLLVRMDRNAFVLTRIVTVIETASEYGNRNYIVQHATSHMIASRLVKMISETAIVSQHRLRVYSTIHGSRPIFINK